MRRLAILDDYNRFATTAVSWGEVAKECSVSVFDRHLEKAEAASALKDFEIVCTLRERMAFPRSLIESLPNLRLIAATGARHHRSMDIDAATSRGVLCCFTTAHGAGVNAPAEHVWALVLALARHLPKEVNNMRNGGWQSTLGIALRGRTLGLLGLGRVAQAMCPVAKAFGMDVIAWSQNLTEDRATEHGVRLVAKDALFQESDFLSVNLMLSERTLNLVRTREIGLMKPTAFLINTARGPIVNEDAVLLAPYDDMGAFSGRVRVSVPRMGVGEGTANTLALVLHELATNSLKYGALSSAIGTLDVSCTELDDDIVMVWIERGGPLVEAPTGEGGFGSKMVARGLATHLGGSIDRAWSPEGAIVTVRMNQQRLAA